MSHVDNNAPAHNSSARKYSSAPWRILDQRGIGSGEVLGAIAIDTAGFSALRFGSW
jgi:hypothetical protein